MLGDVFTLTESGTDGEGCWLKIFRATGGDLTPLTCYRYALIKLGRASQICWIANRAFVHLAGEVKCNV